MNAYTIGSLIRFMVAGPLWQRLGRKTLQRKVNPLMSPCMSGGFGRIGPLLYRESQVWPLPFVVVEQGPHMIERLGKERLMQVEDDVTGGGSFEKTASGATA